MGNNLKAIAGIILLLALALTVPILAAIFAGVGTVYVIYNVLMDIYKSRD